jgi:hypothetical protein
MGGIAGYSLNKRENICNFASNSRNKLHAFWESINKQSIMSKLLRQFFFVSIFILASVVLYGQNLSGFQVVTENEGNSLITNRIDFNRVYQLLAQHLHQLVQIR